ncbi:MAG: tetratricopeptide repeat protein [Planctomycetota bacterium]|jgi:tetratricopeptide (TPR) repeat protein
MKTICHSLVTRGTPLALLLAALAGCFTPPGPLSVPAQRFAGVDVCRRAVTTDSPEAQAWFDQGLTFLYGFNHAEAVRSFHAATLADPDCTMAWWGLALASGTDINDKDMSEDDARRGYDAAQAAVRTSSGATAVEAALAHAITARYAWPPPEDRTALDEAYAAAMQKAWEAHPDDPDVATAFADSLMLLQPWDYWTPEHEPKGRIEEAVAALEHALSITPDHAGACHFLVHALEAGDPARAEAAADRLVGAVPGSGHLLHMPSHIYVHIGRYADAADVNEQAIAADQAYFEKAQDPGFYMGYHAHNVHMLAYSAAMEGREHAAMAAAMQLERTVPEEFIKAEPAFVDGLMSTRLHVLVRFGRWEEILVERPPADYRLLSIAQRHYARGVALAALGRTEEARAEQVLYEAAAARAPDEWKMGNNEWGAIEGVAAHMLDAEILWREGRADEAFEAMAEGARLEDELVYDEPPGWMQPVRHAWGALLMAADRPAEAETVYRDDLVRNPANGWSLLGLEQALRAQGRSGEADKVAEELAVAWERADADANSSCFCEPGGDRSSG